MAGNSNEPGRTVTSKLAAILIAFTNGRDYTLSELAMQTNLAVSTVHRLLSDLVRASLIERPDGGTYRPGPTLRGLPYLIKPPTLRERAPFVVEDLAASLHTTARLGVVDGLEVAYIEKRPGPEPGTLFPNPARLPLHATAIGKVLLAFGSRSLVRVLGGCDLPRYTARTLVGATDLEGDLQRTRAHGFALADSELQPGSGAVAVPVFDVHGRSIAAIEVEVSPGRAAVELAVPALSMAARCLRREITPALHLRRAADPDEPTGVPAPVRMQA
ncbi:MAG TPA: IclR family transcriptional regulator [Pseudonocardia sp.]|nr:IclR family transcriptional regulator [Pseudonocardia sp.]